MKSPVLHVALDLQELERAVRIAHEAVEGGAEWIEAGTPLIKSVGMEAVRRLHDEFPGHEIVADMKVADTGTIEVEMAAKSGATVVCILGDADDAVIREAVRAVEEELADAGRVVLRASGTEPVIRVMVEGRDRDQTVELAKRLAAVVAEAAT